MSDPKSVPTSRTDDDLDCQHAMPVAEVDITEELVRQLLRDQHGDLAHLDLRRAANGWDNVMYRLGPSHAVRLPRRAIAAGLVAHEQQWLPILAPTLPLPVPAPRRVGKATDYYPWTWSIQPWFEGGAVGNAGWADPTAAAERLGRFLACLHRPAPDNRPINPYRGGPLAERHEMTVERIDQFASDINIDAHLAHALWQRCLDSEPWNQPPVWLHGDLHLFNLIQQSGRLSAVIDFGDICGGDPACDLAIGWYAFGPEHQGHFRSAANSEVRPIDEATWLRARGWCLSIGFTMVAFSADNPSHHQMGRHMVRSALDAG